MRNTSHESAVAHTAALSTPSFASCSCAPWNARLAMSSDTVKPIPATAPPPASAAQPTGRRNLPPLRRVARNDAPRMPAGLPATYATRIPIVTGEVNARPRKGPSIGMPAFPSANSGTIT